MAGNIRHDINDSDNKKIPACHGNDYRRVTIQSKEMQDGAPQL